RKTRRASGQWIASTATRTRAHSCQLTPPSFRRFMSAIDPEPFASARQQCEDTALPDMKLWFGGLPFGTGTTVVMAGNFLSRLELSRAICLWKSLWNGCPTCEYLSANLSDRAHSTTFSGL